VCVCVCVCVCVSVCVGDLFQELNIQVKLFSMNRVYDQVQVESNILNPCCDDFLYSIDRFNGLTVYLNRRNVVESFMHFDINDTPCDSFVEIHSFDTCRALPFFDFFSPPIVLKISTAMKLLLEAALMGYIGSFFV